CALQRMQDAAGGKPCRRFDVRALAGFGEGEAGEAKLAVNQHRAGAAGSLVAPALGRSVPEFLAQGLEQGGSAFHELGPFLAVEGELDRNLLRHLFLPGVRLGPEVSEAEAFGNAPAAPPADTIRWRRHKSEGLWPARPQHQPVLCTPREALSRPEPARLHANGLADRPCIRAPRAPS